MNQIDLASRVAVVTGAARGIGYAVAQRFLQSGADVALWDMDAERLAGSCATLKAAHPERRVEALVLDLSDDAAVDAAMAGVAERAGITVEEAERRVAEGNSVRRWITSEDIAYVVTMLASPRSIAINGDAVAAGGGTPRAIYY